MYKLKIIRKFDAAHFLSGYVGKCHNLHGHTWKVVFTFSYESNMILSGSGVEGMIVDFVELKKQIDSFLPDHKYLNEIYEFNPTAENLARWFYCFEKGLNAALCSVEVFESEGASAEYFES
jgi:6-pyruvoyltetrahydropterin/6-carboxytetrahydropterin synthase